MRRVLSRKCSECENSGKRGCRSIDDSDQKDTTHDVQPRNQVSHQFDCVARAVAVRSDLERCARLRQLVNLEEQLAVAVFREHDLNDADRATQMQPQRRAHKLKTESKMNAPQTTPTTLPKQAAHRLSSACRRRDTIPIRRSVTDVDSEKSTRDFGLGIEESTTHHSPRPAGAKPKKLEPMTMQPGHQCKRPWATPTSSQCTL